MVLSIEFLSRWSILARTFDCAVTRTGVEGVFLVIVFRPGVSFSLGLFVLLLRDSACCATWVGGGEVFGSAVVLRCRFDLSAFVLISFGLVVLAVGFDADLIAAGLVLGVCAAKPTDKIVAVRNFGTAGAGHGASMAMCTAMESTANLIMFRLATFGYPPGSPLRPICGRKATVKRRFRSSSSKPATVWYSLSSRLLIRPPISQFLES